MKKIVFSLLFVFIYSSVWADEVATLSNGEKVILKDDGTWSYQVSPERKAAEKYKEVKLSDLKADIDSLEGKKVKIQSLAEMFNFILMLKQEKMDPAPLSVNVNRLSHNDIKHLREECNKGCQVTVYGKVGDIMGNEKGIIADVIEW